VITNNKRVLLSLFSVVAFAVCVSAQTQNMPLHVTTPSTSPMAVATGNDLYCAGYIQTTPISTQNKLIAGQDEADKFAFTQNNFLYINAGGDQGVKVGDMFSVIRPQGSVKSKWSKKGNLGFYVQEVGSLEVVRVKQNVSAVRVKWSCDSFSLGDVVQHVETRTSPLVNNTQPMDVFGDPSGKATGRILMSRSGAESLAKNFVAYVDLGADDQVKVGDTLTVFRPIEKGNLDLRPDRESATRDYGFQSDTYGGGRFSNQATTKTGDRADGGQVTTASVRNSRPKNMRKVVGEAVVLNVKEKTATVIITRNAQEIHTGDWVEVR